MLRVKDVMTTDVVMVDGSATVAEAIALMKQRNVGTLIVEHRSDEDAYGIVTAADIVYKVAANEKDPAQVRVHEIMSKPCIIVTPNLGLKYAARLFANTKVRRAPVIRERLLGILSVTDIIRKAM